MEDFKLANNIYILKDLPDPSLSPSPTPLSFCFSLYFSWLQGQAKKQTG